MMAEKPWRFMSAGTDGKLCWWDFEELDSAEIDMDRTTDYEMMPVAEYSVGADVAIRTVVRSGKDGSELDPRHMLLVDENGALRRLPIEEAYEHKGARRPRPPRRATRAPRRRRSGLPLRRRCRGTPPCRRCAQRRPAVGDEVSMAAPEPSPEYDAALAKGAEAVVTLQQFHAGAVMGMDASPVDHFCATGGADGTVRCFDYVAKTELFGTAGRERASPLWSGRRPPSPRRRGRSSPASATAWCACSARGNAYDESGNPGGWTREQVFKPHNGSVTAMAFSSDGKLFATAGSDGIAFLFQSGQGAPVGAATRSYEPVGFVNADPSAAGNNARQGTPPPRAGYGTMVARGGVPPRRPRPAAHALRREGRRGGAGGSRGVGGGGPRVLRAEGPVAKNLHAREAQGREEARGGRRRGRRRRRRRRRSRGRGGDATAGGRRRRRRGVRRRRR